MYVSPSAYAANTKNNQRILTDLLPHANTSDIWIISQLFKVHLLVAGRKVLGAVPLYLSDSALEALHQNPQVPFKTPILRSHGASFVHPRLPRAPALPTMYTI